ncbi:MAG: Permease of the drug/metabolite transporter (DMT) superfamily, partial [uncultured Rubrobacteraceae bacterium]
DGARPRGAGHPRCPLGGVFPVHPGGRAGARAFRARRGARWPGGARARALRGGNGTRAQAAGAVGAAAVRGGRKHGGAVLAYLGLRGTPHRVPGRHPELDHRAVHCARRCRVARGPVDAEEDCGRPARHLRGRGARWLGPVAPEPHRPALHRGGAWRLLLLRRRRRLHQADLRRRPAVDPGRGAADGRRGRHDPHRAHGPAGGDAVGRRGALRAWSRRPLDRRRLPAVLPPHQQRRAHRDLDRHAHRPCLWPDLRRPFPRRAGRRRHHRRPRRDPLQRRPHHRHPVREGETSGRL